MNLYLAHPFDSRHTMRAWELRFESQTGIQLTNPFYDRDRKDIISIDSGRHERYEKLDSFTLVNNDLSAIYESDGILAIVGDYISFGTIMEIVYAYKARKKVYMVITNGHEDHPWLVYHATRIFTTLGDFQHFITEDERIKKYEEENNELSI